MSESNSVGLKRSLGFWALLAYGVGDMLGAGIYALAGEVAGIAGYWAWLSFGVAMGVAALTAASYAELGSKYPKSGGAAYFCEIAYRSPALSLFIGWLVFCSGLVSMAAGSRAFAGYAVQIVPFVPLWLAILFFLFIVWAINVRGIELSSAANILCTVVEFSGLLIVIGTGLYAILGGHLQAPTEPVTPPSNDSIALMLLIQGAGLAFFALIGFEDLANVAEEVESPARVFPIALITALLVAGMMYMIVVAIATAVIPPAQLAESKAPLLTVVRTAAPALPDWGFTIIALFAVANTALLNCIMGSRLIYGMARQGLLPQWLGHVHAVYQTPHRAATVVFVVALALALTGTVKYLAGTTSLLLLIVFAFVNGAVLLLRRRDPQTTGFRVPWPFPALGIVVSLGLATFLHQASMYIAAGLAAVGAAIVFIYLQTHQTKPIT